MTLTDVLPQVEQLDRDDLLGLQATIGQLLRARDYVPGDDEVVIIDERYNDYLANPESSISVDELMTYPDTLIAA